MYNIAKSSMICVMFRKVQSCIYTASCRLWNTSRRENVNQSLRYVIEIAQGFNISRFYIRFYMLMTVRSVLILSLYLYNFHLLSGLKLSGRTDACVFRSSRINSLFLSLVSVFDFLDNVHYFSLSKDRNIHNVKIFICSIQFVFIIRKIIGVL